MSKAPRGWTTDEDGRPAAAERWPVLVRLPNVAVEPNVARPSKSGVPGGSEYRFDPPQPSNHSSQAASSHSGPSNSHVAPAAEPHLYGRRRSVGQRGFPRRESPILPQTNPFSNPRPRLIDSLAPAVRFLTMVALFTAAGIWIQMVGRHAASSVRSSETPKTAAQPEFTPAKNVGDHTTPAPTATGPIQSAPKPSARVSQADRDDFAAQENTAAGPVPTGRPVVIPPHFLISAGSNVPRVRVADSAADDAGQGSPQSEEATTMARFPGFSPASPTR
jgi:hypothetical protein